MNEVEQEFHQRAKYLAFATGLTRGRDEAEDLVSDVFIKLLEGVKIKGNPAPLIMTMIRNDWYDKRRSADIRKTTSLDRAPEERALEHEDGRASRLDSMIEEDERQRNEVLVQKALSKIPEHMRGIVYWIDGKGKDYSWAAEKYGLPLGTVRSRLFRGRAALVQEMR